MPPTQIVLPLFQAETTTNNLISAVSSSLFSHSDTTNRACVCVVISLNLSFARQSKWPGYVPSFNFPSCLTSNVYCPQMLKSLMLLCKHRTVTLSSRLHCLCRFYLKFSRADGLSSIAHFHYRVKTTQARAANMGNREK